MKVIYQVGRLDNPAQATKEFYIKNFHGEKVDESGKAELSSIVLRDFLRKRNYEAKTVIVYPVSIVFNSKLPEYIQPEELKNELVEIFKDPSNYLKNPHEFIDRIELERNRDEKLIVHSLGEYLGISLDANYDDIVLEILFDMIERYLKGELEELYLDISSGHNIYISAILEAARHFAVFSHLVNWIDDTKSPKIYITFSDPIIGSSAKSFEIHIQQQRFTAFFSSPIKSKEAADYNFSFLREIYPDPNNNSKGSEAVKLKQQAREKRKKLKEKIEMFCLLFSAIKNNVPLYLYYQHYHSADEIKEEIFKLIDHAKARLCSDYQKSPNLNKRAYIDAVLSLGFYIGIVNVLEKYNVTMFCHDTGIDIETVKNSFSEIYLIFRLHTNIVMLGNEVSNTQEKLKQIGDISTWTGLYRIIDPDKSAGEIDPRNFFAHSGFERNATEVRTENDRVLVRYSLNVNFNDINCWLKRRLE
ncbi:CRISPR-associated protein, MJ1666 family [Caldicellulosiruptor acetigenus I77R1B]|uniref:CRISPR-associated protein, MJ1666 family n=1 Tax=Caldicellulosiruptor acetigenus (strain ATCC 700853 / DSM 12137 / I77R1B) TaxID=632335 RepID=E4S8J5_CALA7|nr:CRISPR-associated CARF protein Csx1 [Caldicellulosiruptor acetigenus]ADQ41977.1 CRISPR-associated protein, MJ1666 family [Caldicellulosiruptor acetigenus I77R1B]